MHQPNRDNSDEIMWPPYDAPNALTTPDVWSELSDTEKEQLREITNQLDAAAGTEPGTALGAIVSLIKRNRMGRL
jgi:hypothetical protein